MPSLLKANAYYNLPKKQFQFEMRSLLEPETEIRPLDLVRPQTRVDLPITSPIYDLQFLRKGWDDSQTPPLSVSTLICAHHVWRDVQLKRKTAGLPHIAPGPGGFIEFDWFTDEPDKRLLLWVYGEPRFHVEYTLELNGEEIDSGDVESLHASVALVEKYAALENRD